MLLRREEVGVVAYRLKCKTATIAVLRSQSWDEVSLSIRCMTALTYAEETTVNGSSTQKGICAICPLLIASSNYQRFKDDLFRPNAA